MIGIENCAAFLTNRRWNNDIFAKWTSIPMKFMLSMLVHFSNIQLHGILDIESFEVVVLLSTL